MDTLNKNMRKTLDYIGTIKPKDQNPIDGRTANALVGRGFVQRLKTGYKITAAGKRALKAK